MSQGPGYHHHGKYVMLGFGCPSENDWNSSKDVMSQQFKEEDEKEEEDAGMGDADSILSMEDPNDTATTANTPHTVIVPVTPPHRPGENDDDKRILKSLVETIPTLLDHTSPPASCVSEDSDYQEGKDHEQDDDDCCIFELEKRHLTKDGEQQPKNRSISVKEQYMMSSVTENTREILIVEPPTKDTTDIQECSGSNALRPILKISVGLWAVSNLVGAYWAVCTHSLVPLELCSQALSLFLAALPPLLFSSDETLTLSTLYSSLFLVLYAIKNTLVLTYLEYPQATRLFIASHITAEPLQNYSWATSDTQEQPIHHHLYSTEDGHHSSLAWALHRRRQHHHPHHPAHVGVPFNSMAVYEASCVLWMVLAIGPHLAGVASRNTTDSSKSGSKGGAEMLGILVCLAGLLLQGLVLRPYFVVDGPKKLYETIHNDRTGADHWDSASKAETIPSELCLSASQTLDVAELLFWVGILVLNIKSMLSLRRRGWLLRMLAFVLFLGAMSWTFLLQTCPHNDSRLQGGNSWSLSSSSSSPPSWICEAEESSWLAVLVSATRATFVRYNVFDETQDHRFGSFRHHLEATGIGGHEV